MMKLEMHALPKNVETYLHRQGWIQPEDRVLALEKPGEGNMNVVVRVKLKGSSLILKQARPYVNKYPQIPAPLERVAVENRCYELMQRQAGLQEYLPRVIGFDAGQHILALEDLGAGADYTFLYRKDAVAEVAEMEAAVRFLSQLHATDFPDAERRRFPDNLALRRLNHEHLFHYPYLLDNGFDLDTVQPGLQEIAMIYKTDEKLKKQIRELGDRYLSAGPALLHGDYYPGSWLRVGGHFHVIDPEFCFFGPAEYDYGVMVAHFHMAQLPEATMQQALGQYAASPGFSFRLAGRFTGMEILRRIIGLAQLPLELSLPERAALLEMAAELVLGARGSA